jgi:UPF0755 protein
VFWVTVLALLLLVLTVFYITALQPVSGDTQTKLIHIPPSNTKMLVAQLQREGLIRNDLAFRLLAQANAARYHKQPQAGYYDLSPSMAAEEIWQRLAAGEVAKRKVTFPEGFTVEQMAERLQSKLEVDAGLFKAAALGLRVKRSLPFKLPAGLVEGYLFPTTYTLPVGAEAEQVVGEMAATFSEVFFRPHRAEIEGHKLSLHEIVTLASLVEREARVAEERALIAGVLMNRLQKGMRLQCDASVQYALGQHKSRLLYRDLKVDSPYNTYLHAGLPPGAICNPGLAALKAALRPAKTEALFYVARADGSHVFTRTYEEHLQAIRRVRGR